jgi:biopolymer transport protein ExbB
MRNLSLARHFFCAFLFLFGVGMASALMDAKPVHAQEAAAEDPELEMRKSETQLQYYYRSLGPMYTVIFLSLSFVFVALHLVEGFESHVKEKRYQEAYEMAKNDQSFLGKVLAAGLGKLSAGYPQAIEAMQEVGEEETMRLEHKLSYVALIGAIAPMVGLLGTVDGMTAAFQTIATSGTQPDPKKLADNIATALVTTLFGLWIAIPAVSFYNIIKNRMARLLLEVGMLSEGLMSRFQNVGAKK